MEKKKKLSTLVLTGWLLIVYGFSSFFSGCWVIFLLTTLFGMLHKPISGYHSLMSASAELFMSIFMVLPNMFVAIGMFVGGMGVLRLKVWGRWIVTLVLLIDFMMRLFRMYAFSFFNIALNASVGRSNNELTAWMFFLSLFMELLILLYFTRLEVKEQFK